VQNRPIRPHPDHRGPGAQRVGWHRGAQHGEQVGAVNHGDRPVTALHLGGVGAGQPPPGGILNTGLPSQRSPAADRLAHPERVQCAQCIGPQGQARADLGELGRTLKDLDLPALPGQGQRGCQPADPAADDDRFHDDFLPIGTLCAISSAANTTCPSALRWRSPRDHGE
jgi:hypothetical protein